MYVASFNNHWRPSTIDSNNTTQSLSLSSSSSHPQVYIKKTTYRPKNRGTGYPHIQPVSSALLSPRTMIQIVVLCCPSTNIISLITQVTITIQSDETLPLTSRPIISHNLHCTVHYHQTPHTQVTINSDLTFSLLCHPQLHNLSPSLIYLILSLS